MSATILFKLGSNPHVLCHVYPDQPPILGMWSDDSALDIFAGKEASANVEFARQLAAAATKYLQAMEEQHQRADNRKVPDIVGLEISDSAERRR